MNNIKASLIFLIFFSLLLIIVSVSAIEINDTSDKTINKEL